MDIEQLDLFAEFADDIENVKNEHNEHNEQKTNTIKDINEDKIINETVKFPANWSITDKINYLQRKILLNAILYYEYDKSYVTDNYYDGMSHQLVQMQKEYFNNDKDRIKQETEYGYAFFDFDGNTGFDLCSRLNKKDGEKLRNMCTYQIYRKEN